MYATVLGIEGSVESLSSLESLCALAQIKVSRKCFALLFFAWRNFSPLRNENSFSSSQLPTSPHVSARAVFPLPLLPIRAARPGFTGTAPENQSSGSVEL